MSSLQDKINATRRLLILQFLEQDVDYTLNDQMLKVMLEATGENLALDIIRTQLAWLEEQSLITLQTSSVRFVAKLTGRGLDVAQGSGRQPGVARPRPE